jgi:hypothetical protein
MSVVAGFENHCRGNKTLLGSEQMNGINRNKNLNIRKPTNRQKT